MAGIMFLLGQNATWHLLHELTQSHSAIVGSCLYFVVVRGLREQPSFQIFPFVFFSSFFFFIGGVAGEMYCMMIPPTLFLRNVFHPFCCWLVG